MRAVLVLDFDGTVIDTEWPAYCAAAELWAGFGVELTIEDWAWRIGTNGHDDPFTELEKRLGRALDPALQVRRLARKNQLTDEAPLRPGVQRWLDDAHALGVPVGIASSSPRGWIERNLTRLGLLDRFACVACVDDHPAKPDPTSFRRAVEQLGGDPACSVAVEDSEHGVTAAVDAGLYTVAVPHDLTNHMDLARAHAQLASLDDLTLAAALERAASRPQRGGWSARSLTAGADPSYRSPNPRKGVAADAMAPLGSPVAVRVVFPAGFSVGSVAPVPHPPSAGEY